MQTMTRGDGGARARLAPGLALAATLMALPVSLAAQAESFALGGNRVQVHNIAGTVTIRSGSGSDVSVRVERQGRDGSQLRVEQRTIDGGAALVVVYPSDEIVYGDLGMSSRSNFDISSDGRLDQDGGRRVTVRSSGSGLAAWADLTISIPAGREVEVYHGVGGVDIEGVDASLRVDAHSGAVRARDMSGFLDLDTGSGSIEVTGMQGDLRIDTGSGGVTVAEVTGEALIIDTGSGGVRGSSIQVSELGVDTGSGGIRLEGVSASEILLDTGSGSVELDLLTDVIALAIDTGSGGVTLTVPANLGADIEVETGSGGIDFDFPISVSRVERQSLVGTIGDGDGRIVIDTGSGSVRLIRR